MLVFAQTDRNGCPPHLDDVTVTDDLVIVRLAGLEIALQAMGHPADDRGLPTGESTVVSRTVTAVDLPLVTFESSTVINASSTAVPVSYPLAGAYR